MHPLGAYQVPSDILQRESIHGNTGDLSSRGSVFTLFHLPKLMSVAGWLCRLQRSPCQAYITEDFLEGYNYKGAMTIMGHGVSRSSKFWVCWATSEGYWCQPWFVRHPESGPVWPGRELHFCLWKRKKIILPSSDSLESSTLHHLAILFSAPPPPSHSPSNM